MPTNKHDASALRKYSEEFVPSKEWLLVYKTEEEAKNALKDLHESSSATFSTSLVSGRWAAAL